MARKGENIYKRKDGRWEARYIHHYENGKARYRYLYGATYAQARAKKRAELSGLAQARVPSAACPLTFKEAAALWLSSVRAGVKESTYARYRRIVEACLLPLLGERPLARLEGRELSGLTERLLREGGAQRKGLAPKTVSDILCVLKAVLRCAGENGCPVPPPASIKYPAKSPKTVRILDGESRVKLERLLTAYGDLTGLGIVFALFTGVRIGELCGLRWSDIDFAASTVTIRRTVGRIADPDPASGRKTRVAVGAPKTGSSARTIPLPGFLLACLQKQRADADSYVLTGTKECMEPHRCYMRYRRFLKENEIGDHTFHALRHTFATRCVELGFDAKSLSEILGHASVTTTLSVYVHPTLAQKRRQMELLAPQ